MYIIVFVKILSRRSVVPKTNSADVQRKFCLMILLTDKRTRDKLSTQISLFSFIVSDALS